MTKVIDISHHNGKIDFKKVKESGIDTVIIRTGYGFYSEKQIDKRFYEYYDKAREMGFKIGAYHYSYAENADSAKREAEAMLKIIGDRRFELPLFFDIEEKSQAKLSRAVCSDMVRAFCGHIESCGHRAGVYSYDSFFGSNLDDDICGKYAVWVARVEDIVPKDCKRYDIWQYSWKGRVAGINGDVDMDRIYVPDIIVGNKTVDNDFVVGLHYDITNLNIDVWKKTEVLNILDNVVCTLLSSGKSAEQILSDWKAVYNRLNGGT